VSEQSDGLSIAPSAESDVPRPKRKHLYEIDIVRILTFACVIAVHVTSHTVAPTDLLLNGLLALVHFTREVFFALTGFVLVYSYLNHPVPMRKFWPKRFLLVGVPYLVWSAIYVVLPWLHTPVGNAWSLIPLYIHDVLFGTAYYHLYFLLITMQVYLLFPVLMWLIRKTRGHHILVLSISFAGQLLITGLDMYRPGSLHWINGYDTVINYQGFIILGAVAADHSTAFLSWVRSHRRLIGLITLTTGAAMIAVYLIGIHAGYTPGHAGAPVQPMIMVWSIGVGLGFLALGTLWADRRKAGTHFARGVDLASDRSFGIFLSHPIVLWFLLWVGDDWFERTVPRPWLTLVIYILVVVGAVLVTELARRSPLSLALTGRPFKRSRRSVGGAP
jgi:peptidoglycan/LPS O-acetylase OafA/YrhL